jgi:hypothetical protein
MNRRASANFGTDCGAYRRRQDNARVFKGGSIFIARAARDLTSTRFAANGAPFANPDLPVFS